jgi:hypothetical protein
MLQNKLSFIDVAELSLFTSDGNADTNRLQLWHYSYTIVLITLYTDTVSYERRQWEVERGYPQLVRTCLSASSSTPHTQLDLNNAVSSDIRMPSKENHYKQSHRSPMVISPCTLAVKWTSTSRSNSMRILSEESFCLGSPLSSRSAPFCIILRISSGDMFLISSSDILTMSDSCFLRPRGVAAGSSRSALPGKVSYYVTKKLDSSLCTYTPMLRIYTWVRYGSMD